MASIELTVTPGELKNKSGEITKSITQIESAFEEIGKLVTGTKKYWEGDASDQHIKSYTKMKDDISTIVKRLKEHPKDLEKMAGVYEETENAAKKIASVLPADIL